jgi:hypothetical protein
LPLKHFFPGFNFQLKFRQKLRQQRRVFATEDREVEKWGKHGNLGTRTSTVGTPANSLGERTPYKKSADLHSRQGNLLQRNKFFSGLQNLS